MVVGTGRSEINTRPAIHKSSCLTLNPIIVRVGIFDHKIVATIISKGCKYTITNFYELCYDDSFTQLSYRFVVLLWSELSHHIFPINIMMTVLKKAAISYSLLCS